MRKKHRRASVPKRTGFSSDGQVGFVVCRATTPVQLIAQWHGAEERVPYAREIEGDESFEPGQSKKIIEEDDVFSDSEESDDLLEANESGSEMENELEDESRVDKEEEAHRLFEETASEYERLAAEQYRAVRLKNSPQERQKRRMSHNVQDEKEQSIIEEQRRVRPFWISADGLP